VNVPNLIAVRCAYCSKFRVASRVHRLAGHAQAICDHCWEWHNRALEFLAGGQPPGCQACDATWETLRDRAAGDKVRLYCVPRDGIYQLLCAECVRPYIGKRRDLYKDTAFGAALRM
jgi:hypothetical protein